MWIIPSRGRPKLLARLAQVSEQPAVIVLDQDDADNYAAVPLPDNWQTVILPRCDTGTRLNRILAMFPNEPFYGFGADDIDPPQGWDTMLASKASSRDIIWPEDGIANRCTHPVIGGDLIRAMGFIAPACLRHFYIDTFWEDLAKCLPVSGLIMGLNVNHCHFSNGKAVMDDTYKGRPSSHIDQVAYYAFKQTQFNQLVDKCLTLFA